MRRTDAMSIGAFVLMILLAVGTAVSVLPGCDPRNKHQGDSGYDTGDNPE